jgi:hypothetical protein
MRKIAKSYFRVLKISFIILLVLIFLGYFYYKNSFLKENFYDDIVYSVSEIKKLTATQIKKLNSINVSKLTRNDILSLSRDQLKAIYPKLSQAQKKSAEETIITNVEKIPTEQELKSYTPEQLKLLNMNQIGKIITYLNPQQIPYLTIENISPQTINFLPQLYIEALTTEQIKNLDISQISVLDYRNINYMTVKQINDLTETQINYFTMEQIKYILKFDELLDITAYKFLYNPNVKNFFDFIMNSDVQDIEVFHSSLTLLEDELFLGDITYRRFAIIIYLSAIKSWNRRQKSNPKLFKQREPIIILLNKVIKRLLTQRDAKLFITTFSNKRSDLFYDYEYLSN